MVRNSIASDCAAILSASALVSGQKKRQTFFTAFEADSEAEAAAIETVELEV